LFGDGVVCVRHHRPFRDRRRAAIYEWRKKTTILKHDFSLDETTQSESSRDGYRAAQAFSDAHRTGGSISGNGGPHQ